MKDSAVGPTGLINPARSRRMLDAIAKRVASCLAERERLKIKHEEQRAEEEIRFDQQKQSVTQSCQAKRLEMLTQWDQAEERLTHAYEKKAFAGRSELNRVSAFFRRKKAEEQNNIERKVAARHQAVLKQYDNRKDQPEIQKQKEIESIDASLLPIEEHIERGRALTVRRLDGLMEVGPPESPEEDMREPAPKSVDDTIESVARITRRCRGVVAEMQSGLASKIVDSFYLPAGVGVFCVMWASIAFLTVTEHPFLWAGIGIVPGGVIGFTIFLLLMMPLKRMTRRLYPRVERLARAANQCAEQGREIARKTAATTSQELIDRRDAHVAAAKRWKTEHLAELDQRIELEQKQKQANLVQAVAQIDHQYEKALAEVSQQMLSASDTVADSITQTMTQSAQDMKSEREQNEARRATELGRLAVRLKTGIRGGTERIRQTHQLFQEKFPCWQEVLDGDPDQYVGKLDYLPLGSLRIDGYFDRLFGTTAEEQQNTGNLLDEVLGDSELPKELAVGLHRKLHSCLLIRADADSLDSAVSLCHQVLWRLLTRAKPGGAKLTLLDPMGRGQNFTSFMALADHDPSLVTHRVWTTDSVIEQRLAEIAHQVEEVLQTSLRDRFATIEDYNQLAGSMAQPYQAVAAVGLPAGLSREGYQHLQAIINSGLRCGVFTVIVCDKDQPWPADMPPPGGENVLKLSVRAGDHWQLESDGLADLPFEPFADPPSSMRADLAQQLGQATLSAAKVEVPLAQVLEGSPAGAGSTDDGIAISIGSQGADRTLQLLLGEGVRQHVLIAGKTGSGKSTLLHAIITAGAYRFRPEQLNFYLLDFKKGVEFKPYADSGLPHARVIGIESEREFGHSVLQRLDIELHQRGEKFRDAGVQELGDYRRQTGQTMPRIMLVIDEFQELFVKDDRIAGDCSMLMDRLVRQGRSFGIHVVLSSQSLAGAYSLPRATLGQMAVRIAMQCSESDATLILGDDNTAARLISRPGEAIYNDAGGLIEGNQPFQVAWLSPVDHKEILAAITSREHEAGTRLPPALVFEGNRPCRWTSALAKSIVSTNSSAKLHGLLGEAVEIGPPVAVSLTPENGQNILLVAGQQGRLSVLSSMLAGFAESSPDLQICYFDDTRPENGDSVADWLVKTGMDVTVVSARESEAAMVSLAQTVKDRTEDDSDHSPQLVVVDPLERFRDLKQDDSFNFSLDSAGGLSGAQAIQEVLRDGPAVGIFVMLVCGSSETLTRWFPRSNQHDLGLRILGQMNQSDSALLIDSPSAADLSVATMLVYDHASGKVTKFRPCAVPDSAEVRKWLGS